jgi:nucleoside-diphosphate-sugar epimerase
MRRSQRRLLIHAVVGTTLAGSKPVWKRLPCVLWSPPRPVVPVRGRHPPSITALLEGEPPTVFGDGEQSRDFTFIDNVIEANMLAANADAEDVSGRTVNIACGDRISLNKLLDDLCEILNVNIEASYLESRPGDVKHSLADISNARATWVRAADRLRRGPVADGR